MHGSVSRILAGCGLVLLLHIQALAQAPGMARVSVATGGGQTDGDSWYPTLSADGRYVAFQSTATNLVANDTNGLTDVFVHDRQTGVTTRVSIPSGGGEGNSGSDTPAISADGRYVAFVSEATNLVPGDTNGESDVFVHDRQTGTTTRVSIPSGGGEANSRSAISAISADGRYVAFVSEATNLVPDDTNGAEDVFVHDRQTGTTTRVSIPSGGGQANSDSYAPALSADGRYVAFGSGASNLVAGDTNAIGDVFVHDRQAGTTARVSIATGGFQAYAFSGGHTSLSADGRYVTFGSVASNLVAGDTNATEDVFVHDQQTAVTTRVSVASGGGQANGLSPAFAALSADGRYVAFGSVASNLVAGDTNATGDVFVHDRQTGVTTRVSAPSGGGEANGGSYTPTLSADGRYVAFVSEATNLVPGDTNGSRDVFVHDREAIAPVRLPAGDYDADGKADVAVFRPSSGTWYELRSSTGSGYGVGWGIADDVPVPADYDGDVETDPAVFRPSTGVWYVLQSTTGTGLGVQWGVTDDVPVPADYDGDGKTDVAVWRPSTGVWYIIRSSDHTAVGISWGMRGDAPVPGDFDGDKKADPTVFRASTGTWYELRSSTAAGYGVVWGQNGDVPLAGDYDGDGKADPTVFRASTGTWYELRSTTGVGFGVLWGTVADVPIVGDYDGDGKADPTVFRASTSTWYQLRSTTGSGHGFVWGATGDLPQ